jgi:hypothetical protein
MLLAAAAVAAVVPAAMTMPSSFSDYERNPMDLEQRLDRLEQAMAEHIELCAQQKKDIAELTQLLHDVKGTIRVGSAVKSLIGWACSIGVAIAGLYWAVKGKG